MSAGLMVFALITLPTILNHALAGNPALPIIWILSVPTTAIFISWLTWYFYRDFNLHNVNDGYLTDIEEIVQ